MTDNLDTSAIPYAEWNRDQRAWIHLYYKLLLQTRRQNPSFPVCTSDSVAAIAHQMFFRSPEEKQHGMKPHSLEDDEVYKATFIRYRNVALPNMMSHIVQLCKDNIELDSRCSIPQVFINRPMLDEYIKISGKYFGGGTSRGPENDDPEPWESQTTLWGFISKAVTERFLQRGVLDSQDTLVQSFARVTGEHFLLPPTDEERAELILMQQVIQRLLARANSGNSDDGTA